MTRQVCEEKTSLGGRSRQIRGRRMTKQVDVVVGHSPRTDEQIHLVAYGLCLFLSGQALDPEHDFRSGEDVAQHYTSSSTQMAAS